MDYNFISLRDDSTNTLQGDIFVNGTEFLVAGKVFKWNAKIAENRMIKRLGGHG